MRLCACVGLVLSLALVGAGCGSDGGGNGGSGKGAKIALLLPETKTTRYEEQDRPLFEKAVKKQCPDCEVLYSNADADAAKQQAQAESAIANGAKALVVSPVDAKSAASIVARAHQSDVKVLSYGRMILDSDVDYLVSYDPINVGKQQGNALVKALKERKLEKKPIVMINGGNDDLSAGFNKGAHQVFKQEGIKVAKEYDTPDWAPDKAQTEMDQAITSVGKNGFGGVYSANDAMGGAVIASMKGAGLDPKKIPVTGQDAEVAGLQRILTGEQLMTIFQPIATEADAAAKISIAAAKGKEPDPKLFSTKRNNGKRDVPTFIYPTSVIDKNNVQKVIDAKFATVKQICTPAYREACDRAGLK